MVLATPGVAAAADPDCRTLATDGSAGLDLRLLCTLGEIVGHYTGTSYASPEDVPVALLGGMAAGLGAVVALAVLLLVRLGRHWARPRRPADEEWWACPACHSLNEPTLTTCYRCGVAHDP